MRFPELSSAKLRQVIDHVRLHRSPIAQPPATLWPVEGGSANQADFCPAQAQSSAWQAACLVTPEPPAGHQSWAKFCVGAVDALWHARPVSTEKLLHVFANHTLTCVFDFGSHSARYCLLPPDLNAQWHAGWRPRAAAAPAYFEDASLWDLVWTWGQYSNEALAAVPPKYRHTRVQLRRLPRIRANLLEPRHLRLFERFAQSPQSIEDWLQASTSAQDARQICGDFAALHATRCLRVLE
jgi:hypothetical protein